MPAPGHFLKHQFRLYVALMSLFYDEHGNRDFDTHNGKYLRANSKAYEMAMNIKGLGLKKTLLYYKVSKQKIPAVIRYIRRQALRDDLLDIYGIGPNINREFKQWVAAGMPDQLLNK